MAALRGGRPGAEALPQPPQGGAGRAPRARRRREPGRQQPARPAARLRTHPARSATTRTSPPARFRQRSQFKTTPAPIGPRCPAHRGLLDGQATRLSSSSCYWVVTPPLRAGAEGCWRTGARWAPPPLSGPDGPGRTGRAEGGLAPAPPFGTGPALGGMGCGGYRQPGTGH